MRNRWRRIRYRFRSGGHRRRRPFAHPAARRRRRICGVLAAAAFFVFAGHGLLRAESRLRPVVDELAIAKLNGMVTALSNEAVQQQLEAQSLSYDMLVNRQTNAAGAVTALTLDYTAVNRLKSELALSIQKELDALERVHISVPVGALFSDTLMPGFGIGLPIRTIAAETVEVSILDTFEDAGINQTRHHIEIAVKAPVVVVTPLHRTAAEITTQIPVAETVIVGAVPGTYFSLGK